MKKVIRMPFRVIWFALKNDMYGILFPAAVVIAGIVCGIASGDVGSGHPGYLWNRESDLEPNQ